MAQPPNQPSVNVDRSLHQIFTPEGQPYQAHATDPVWVTRGDPYPYTDGNDIQPLLTGEAYFAALAGAISKADKSIYMLGWQINWDAPLIAGVRLYDSLLAAAKAKPALKIYVLPWEGSSYVPTYATDTITVMKAMNAELGPGGPAGVCHRCGRPPRFERRPRQFF